MNNSPRQVIFAHPVINKLYSFLNDDIVLVWGLVFLAWVLMALIMVTNQHHWSHHHVLIAEKSQPLLPKLLIFILSWQVMTVAMMLPRVSAFQTLVTRGF